MEQQNQNQDADLFGLSIDTTGRAHLTEAAKWARFLAIVGFVFIAFFAVIRHCWRILHREHVWQG